MTVRRRLETASHVPSTPAEFLTALRRALLEE